MCWSSRRSPFPPNVQRLPISPAGRAAWRDTHEGIIDRKTWEKAQEVVEARRKDLQMGVDRKGKETHFLYGKVFCASCGAPYKRRTLPHKRVEG